MDLVQSSSVASFCGLSCFHQESCGDVAARKVKHASKCSIAQTQDPSNQIKGSWPWWKMYSLGRTSSNSIKPITWVNCVKTGDNWDTCKVWDYEGCSGCGQAITNSTTEARQAFTFKHSITAFLLVSHTSGFLWSFPSLRDQSVEGMCFPQHTNNYRLAHFWSTHSQPKDRDLVIWPPINQHVVLGPLPAPHHHFCLVPPWNLRFGSRKNNKRRGPSWGPRSKLYFHMDPWELLWIWPWVVNWFWEYLK